MNLHDWVVAFAAWCRSTPWGVSARESEWAYPFIQLVHFTGLSVWLGTTFALDLHLLGIYRRSAATPAQAAQELFVWNWIGFAIALTGGFMLFSGIADAFIVNAAFQWKLGLFVPLALLWHIVVQRRAQTWGRTDDVPAIGKLAAATEILLWIAVVAAAVQIPSN